MNVYDYFVMRRGLAVLHEWTGTIEAALATHPPVGLWFRDVMKNGRARIIKLRPRVAGRTPVIGPHLEVDVRQWSVIREKSKLNGKHLAHQHWYGDLQRKRRAGGVICGRSGWRQLSKRWGLVSGAATS